MNICIKVKFCQTQNLTIQQTQFEVEPELLQKLGHIKENSFLLFNLDWQIAIVQGPTLNSLKVVIK